MGRHPLPRPCASTPASLSKGSSRRNSSQSRGARPRTFMEAGGWAIYNGYVMGFNCNFMGLNGDLMGLNSELMGLNGV